VKIVAVDLQDMAPLEGVTQIKVEPIILLSFRMIREI
jgi:hypothetical protein